MTKSIWKFPLDPNGVVEMPEGAKIISAREQGDFICVWAEVDPQAAKVERRFAIYGTGWDLPGDPGDFVGSAFLHGGRLVFHVYEQTRL